MITENDLLEAIAECQGQRNPNANTCIKLAAYYTILNNLQSTDNSKVGIPKKETRTYSYSSPDNAEKTIEYISNTDFSRLINGKSAVEMWAIVDELMSVLAIINPKLYNNTMLKFSE